MPSSGFLVGLVGSGIAASLTPVLHEREAEELGLRYLYRRLDLDQLGLPGTAIGEILAAARLTGYDGLNVTHPCKQLVLDHLDALSPEAAALGAVNTVVLRDGRAIGHNTDMSGFAKGIELGLPAAPRQHVVLIGAGGAGAAIAHALLDAGIGVLDVHDLDRHRAETLVATLRKHYGDARARSLGGTEVPEALRVADGLVHATPTGMAAHPGTAVPEEVLRPGLWVADAVYRPLHTDLVVAARASGCRVLDGGRMAVFQAVEAFRLFTGIAPDAERMSRHFNETAGADPAPSTGRWLYAGS